MTLRRLDLAAARPCTPVPGGSGRSGWPRREPHDQPAAAPADRRRGLPRRRGPAARCRRGRGFPASTSSLGVVIVVLRVRVPRAVRRRTRRRTSCSTCPRCPLPGWAAGITLLGPVTAERSLAGLYDGLRLATLLFCLGAANALANPKRLLQVRARRAVRARRGRRRRADASRRSWSRASSGCAGPAGCAAGRHKGCGRCAASSIPVLEDALDRSLRLAAAMDSRGYGRHGNGQPRAAGGSPAALLLGGLLGRLRRRLRAARRQHARGCSGCRARRSALVAAARRAAARRPRGPAHQLPARPVAAAGVAGRRQRAWPPRAG